jgi:Winged helix DNA-binding domain
VGPADADRGVEAMVSALGEDGPLTREQLDEVIAAAGVRTEGQALILVLALACLRGLALRGPVIDGAHAYTLVSDWLGDRPAVDRDVALAELARRYLAGHGPAGERDLARWAGLPLRDARAGLAAVAGELDERDDGLLDLKRRPPAAELPPPKLLGPFDPVLLGWSSREPLLGKVDGRVVAGGIFRAFALVAGRAVATWRMPSGRVELNTFTTLPPGAKSALDAEAADVERFLGT